MNQNLTMYQLHTWVTRKQKKYNMTFCSECYVVLCLVFFQNSHCVYDIAKEKESIRRMLELKVYARCEVIGNIATEV